MSESRAAGAAADVIDFELETDAADEQASDPESQSVKKKARVPKSAMYENWNFEVSPSMRDKFHCGAQCLPCKAFATRKTLPVNPKGSCLAEITAILTHVKNCEHRTPAERQRAAAELLVQRDNKKHAGKRSFDVANDTEGSSSSSKQTSSKQAGSKQPGLSRFLAHKDKASLRKSSLNLSSSACKPLSAVICLFKSGMMSVSETCCLQYGLRLTFQQGRPCQHESLTLGPRLQKT